MGSMPVVPIFAAALALVAPASVAAQAATVYRCADGMGQVTYQQEPCASGTKGRAVEILPDNGLARDSATLESQWSAAAKQGVVSLGMPRRYVRDALGTPAETRQGLPVERATEVWTYRYGDGARRIGFLDGRVTWDRAGDGNTVAPAAPRPSPQPVPASAPQPVPSPPTVAMPRAVPATPAVASQPRAVPAQPSTMAPPLPAGVQQDPSGMIVMRRPDALTTEGSGAGQPTVRVLPLPSQAGASPPGGAPQDAGMIVMRRPDALPLENPVPGQGSPRSASTSAQSAPPTQQGLAPLSSTASAWSPSVAAQGAAPPPASAPAAPRSEAMMLARQSIRPGTSCAVVLAQAGTPDRTDTIRVPAPGGGGEIPAARHSYGSDGSDPPRDVVFTCVGGVVREVERGVR